ncbi:MAG: creatininase family protein [Oscillospiraceae bacterium]|nr:creatininase family protein [Oscillospiraceae bacterium]MBR3474780.1 creatininase family protein [Oscillospiraceae bacterium]
MANEKNQLQHMTWKEVAEVYKKDPVVIIPLGSMEVQGPHAPTGDYLVAEEVAGEVCRRSGAYCAPVVPFGHSEYFRSYPGTFSVRPNTLYNWVLDMCTSLIEHGVTKILFINGHAGNDNILDCLARDIRRENNLVLGRINIWRTATPQMKKELYGDKTATIGHGGGIVDAVDRYLFPGDVKEELAGPNDIVRRWEAFDLLGIGRVDICGIEAFVYTNLEDLSMQGCVGEPLASTAETGHVLFERMVECGCEFVKRMNASDMHAKK